MIENIYAVNIDAPNFIFKKIPLWDIKGKIGSNTRDFNIPLSSIDR
jgi:hypothetical protein